jgi:sugar fermentation stimulation protein A
MRPWKPRLEKIGTAEVARRPISLEERPLTRYLEGKFLHRRDRFTAWVEVDRKPFLAHLPNPGRLGELLKPGAMVLLLEGEDPKRKTPFELSFIVSDGELVSLDSRLPNRIFGEAVEKRMLREFQGWRIARREPRIDRRRLDFQLVNEADGRIRYVEVKSCTLVRDGVALFPDAPTERGRRHVEELMRMRRLGFESSIVFIVQRRAEIFRVNASLDPRFADTLGRAEGEGVGIYAYRAAVNPQGYEITGRIPASIG